MDTEKKTLVVFPTGTLSPVAIEQLRLNGYLAIECDRPKEVVTVLPIAELQIGGGEITEALIDTVKENDERAKSFGKRILAALRVGK